MTEENLGRANADDGIDLIVFWLGYGDELRSFEAGASLRSRTVRAFQDLNAGNRLRRFTFETADPVVALRFKTYGLEPLRQEGGAAVLSLHRDAALASGHDGVHRQPAKARPAQNGQVERPGRSRQGGGRIGSWCQAGQGGPSLGRAGLGTNTYDE